MKTTFSILFLVVLPQFISPSALSDESKAIIVKSSGSGFVSPEAIRDETCSLFMDKVVIEKGFGSLRGGNEMNFSRVIPAKLSGDIKKILNLSKAEKTIETPNNLCDGPSTEVSAHIPGSSESFVIYTTGGCGSPRIERKGPNTDHLLNIINEFCQTTYKTDP